MEPGFGFFALRFSLWPGNLDRGTSQEPLGDRPRRAIGFERHLNLGTDRFAVGREGLGELVLGTMTYEEGSAKSFQQRRLACLIRLNNDVQAVGQAFDHHRLSKFAETVDSDPPETQAHAFSSRLYSTNRRSSARFATDVSAPPTSIRVESFAAATPSMPSTASAARSSSLGRPTRSAARMSR